MSNFLIRFQNDQRGSIAIIFALVIIVLIGAVGLAIDYGRTFSVASKLRAAADAAALAGAKLLDESVTNETIETTADNYFQTQVTTIGAGGLTASPLRVSIDRDASSVQVESDVSVGMTFAQLLNVPSIDFEVSTTVVYKIKKVELAMVLDVTGSMNNNNRLDGVKTAAKNIIDTLVNDTVGKHNRIALVPYSASVNVGSTYRDLVSGGNSLDGCVMERLLPDNRDTDEVSGGNNNYAVNGQLNSGTNDRYICPTAEMMALSKNATALKNAIDSYTADGWTAGHIGLAWGWNTVSPKWKTIFTGDAEPGEYGNENYVKAVILMTDGAFNTAYSGGDSEADQKAESEARTLALCTNMKAQNIRIYTVAFEAPAEAQTLLQSCAQTGNYFNATDSNQLNSAFQSIAENLRSLRLSE